MLVGRPHFVDGDFVSDLKEGSSMWARRRRNALSNIKRLIIFRIHETTISDILVAQIPALEVHHIRYRGIWDDPQR